MARPRGHAAGRARNRPEPTRMKARVKVWLEVEGQYVFGFGLSEILKAVEGAGSIKGAAASLGKSYRYVWGRIKKAERALGAPLVETRVGGTGTSRSSLSALASRLVSDYDALRGRMLDVVDQEFSTRFDPPRGAETARP